MLKRCQVLLNEWLVDYLKFLSAKYNVSFSEIIRTSLCVNFYRTINALYPPARFGISEKKRIGIIKDMGKGKVSQVELHKAFSKIYFEARKATEFRMAQKKRRKK